MGKGDKKSRRGKIVIGTYGVRRPRRSNKQVVVPRKPAVPKPKKQAAEKVVTKMAAEEPVIEILTPVQEEKIEVAPAEVKVEAPATVVAEVTEVKAEAEETTDSEEVKKPAKKAAAKKTVKKADGEEEKPKAAKPRKKAASSDDTKEKAEES
jgi:30S ribosomal protein S31